MNTYVDREQTQAKHFILRGYLQALAFKVLHGWDIVYVDGFSGPWQSRESNFSDTSFMIAIDVLKDAQQRIKKQTGELRTIKCFFSEKDAKAYGQMAAAVAPRHQPTERFEIKTFHGEFADAVSDILRFSGRSFRLVFIDPTGWTEYPLAKITPLFATRECEVLINFMYDHINRFLKHPNETIIASLDPILGGPGWQERLDPTMKPGPAVEKLFRETLKKEGDFRHVVSTRIDRSTQDRPQFFLAFGTKASDGLKAFRQIEYAALREHARNRSTAKTRKKASREGTADMFADHESEVRRATIDMVVAEQKALAREHLLQVLAIDGPQPFSAVVASLLEAFMLRETNVKDLCSDLAREGKIERTWGPGNQKPHGGSAIVLTSG